MNETLKNHKYTVTMPNGKTITRTTKRIYTHVIVIPDVDGHNWVLGWAGSLALAQKVLAKSKHPSVTIIAVDNPR